MAPTTVVAVKFKALPTQIGLLEEAVGLVGIAFIVTFVVPTGLTQPKIVAVTLYVPLAATVAEAIDGFCNEEEKLFGPVQE